MTENNRLRQVVRPTLSARKVYVLTLLAALAFYWATSQRGPGWQDSGMHQLRALRGEYTNPWGLALGHPLYIAMCQPLKVLGSARLATCMNLFSGVGMAITLANVYLLGYWLTRRHLAAVAGAALLCFGHTAWWLATIAETYCWVTAGLTTELLILVQLIVAPRWWKLALGGLVSGLGFSLHNLALLALPVYVVTAILLIRQRRLGWAVLPAAVAAWLAGAGLQLGIIVQEALSSGQWTATIRSALFGRIWQGQVMSTSLGAIGNSALYIGLNWPFLSLVPVLAGWWIMSGRAGRAVGSALGAVTAIHLVFAVRYPVPDQFMFLLPSYVLFAIGAAVGIDRLMRVRSRNVRRVWLGLIVLSMLLTPVLYGLSPAIVDRMGRSIRPNRQLPDRNENRYWLTPWKQNERSADSFARKALAAAEPDGVIV
ncbi:MAG: DUF2723 domain-containing protein, partial [Planctomycetes bacterium]|nr:DUF2723 domain-containing protein [Planctomycetota bacterium]